MKKTILRICSSLVVIALLSSCSDSDDGDSLSFNGALISIFGDSLEMNVSFPLTNSDKSVTLKFHRNSNAKKIPLSEAIEFVKNTNAHAATYVVDVYDCKQFAYKLFQEAQAKNYSTSFVLLTIKDQEVGHALVSLDTTDAGRLFVDITPIINQEKKQILSKRIVYVDKDQQYVRIPVDALPEGFRNQASDFVAYFTQQRDSVEKIKKYNSDLEKLSADKNELEARMQNFQNEINRGVAADQVAQFRNREDKFNEEARILNTRIDELKMDEMRINNGYVDSEWVGKDWVVKSYKLLP